MEAVFELIFDVFMELYIDIINTFTDYKVEKKSIRIFLYILCSTAILSTILLIGLGFVFILDVNKITGIILLSTGILLAIIHIILLIMIRRKQIKK